MVWVADKCHNTLCMCASCVVVLWKWILGFEIRLLHSYVCVCVCVYLFVVWQRWDDSCCVQS